MDNNLVSEIVEIDISALCRICGNVGENMVSIFKAHQTDQNMLSKIRTYLPINLIEQENFPDKICSNCETTIVLWHDFVVDSVDAEEKLNLLITNMISDEKPKENETSVELDSDTEEYNEEENIEYILPNDEIEVIMSDYHETEQFYSEEPHENILQNETDETDLSIGLKQDASTINGCNINLDENFFMTCKFGCGIEFALADYKAHLNNHLKQCIRCNIHFENFLDTERHMEEKHAEDILFCKYCGEYNFKNEHELNVHIEQHDLNLISLQINGLYNNEHPKKYICLICDQIFFNRRLFIIHKQSHLQYNCNICKKTFKKELYLRIHKKDVHSNDTCTIKEWQNKLILCPICDQQFKRKYNMEKHLGLHKVDNYCKICCASFITNSNLQKHIGEHDRSDVINYSDFDMEIECTYENCNEKFYSKFKLYFHNYKEHLQIKIFKCPDCNSGFKTESILETHKKTHSLNFSCSVCMKKFTKLKVLEAHERTHTGDKPYECDICFEKFRSQSNLLQHKQKHSQIRRYKCQYCEAQFIRSNTFREHMRIHLNERPFSCKFCLKSYTQSNVLKKHMAKIHRKCEICDEVIGDKMKILVHMWKCHN